MRFKKRKMWREKQKKNKRKKRTLENRFFFCGETHTCHLYQTERDKVRQKNECKGYYKARWSPAILLSM